MAPEDEGSKQSKGGIARAERLSPEERSRIARLGAEAMWARREKRMGTGIAGAMDWKPPESPDRCWVCGGAFKGGCSAVAKAGAAFPPSLKPPPIVQVCSGVCAADRRFANPWKAKRNPRSASHGGSL